ncbi:MAG: hypothetical protein EP347_05205 [Alphaproteobacteria bacterium]|nr:MAG: hypothetical protein EP347_05205 [Alphaproteobacteria bacterium]
MKSMLYGLAAVAFALLVAGGALAADVEGLCLEEVAASSDVPPEVTQDQINYFCSCLDTAVNGDADLKAEFEEKSASAEEEEMGEAFKAAQHSCQQEALAQ